MDQISEGEPTSFPSFLCSFHYVTSVCPLPHHNQSGAPGRITIIVLHHSAAFQGSLGRARGCYTESLSKANGRCHSLSRSAVCFRRGALTEVSHAHRVNPSLSQLSPPHNVKSFWKEPKGSLFLVCLCGGALFGSLISE